MNSSIGLSQANLSVPQTATQNYLFLGLLELMIYDNMKCTEVYTSAK